MLNKNNIWFANYLFDIVGGVFARSTSTTMS